jgi:hypothetical protein
VKLIPVVPGREAEAGYIGIRHVPFALPVLGFPPQALAQIAGQHGHARHGQKRHRGHTDQQANRQGVPHDRTLVATVRNVRPPGGSSDMAAT